ncbi:MAG: recombinase family protein [Acidimicrobiales bacterium]
MRRVAIYAREDPTADAQARLAAQMLDATATGFVRRRRGRHIATYADLSPATTLERPGLIQLTAHARAGCFDLVVVERRETVAPDPASRRQVRDQLAASGVTVVVIRPSLATRLGRVVAGLALVDLVEDR